MLIYERDDGDENWRSCENDIELNLDQGDRLGLAVKCPGTYWCTNSGKEFNFHGRLLE